MKPSGSDVAFVFANLSSIKLWAQGLGFGPNQRVRGYCELTKASHIQIFGVGTLTLCNVKCSA